MCGIFCLHRQHKAVTQTQKTCPGNRPTTRKETKVETKQKIIDYVKTQLGIDLAKFRTDFSKRWERQNEIIVEYREMPKTKWRNIELLANNGRIRIESVGVWGKMIALK